MGVAATRVSRARDSTGTPIRIRTASLSRRHTPRQRIVARRGARTAAAVLSGGPGSRAMDAVARMRAMVNGYQVSHALAVAASLGLSDLLADGPRTPAELAAATGTHEPTLGRLLRALATVGVYERQDDG